MVSKFLHLLLVSFRLFVASALKEKMRVFLTLVAVSLSIASFFAITTFNLNIIEAFSLTVDAFSGNASIDIYTPKIGIPETYLDEIRELPEVEVASPVVRGVALLQQADNLPVQAIGIDPFSDSSIRSYDSDEDNVEDPLKFLSSPQSVLITERLARMLNVKMNDPLNVVVSSGTKTLFVRGILKEVGPAKIFGGEVMVLDYWAAQVLFNRGQNVDEISIVAKEGINLGLLKETLASILPNYVKIEEPYLRKHGGIKMFASLEFLLASVGLLVIGVAFFFAYNTFQVSFLRRSKEFAILRLLGSTGPQMLTFLLIETLLIGFLGTFIGLYLGYWLAKLNFVLGKEMVAALYFKMLPRSMLFSFKNVIYSAIVGIIVSFAAGIVPSLGARRVSPINALRPINGGSFRSKRSFFKVVFAIVLVFVGFYFINMPIAGIPVLFRGAISICFALVSFVLLTPLLLKISSVLVQALFSKKAIPKLGAEQLERSAHRNAFAAFAVLLSFMLFIAMGLILKSFEKSVDDWARFTIRNDLTILPQGAMPGHPTFSMDASMRSTVKDIEDVAAVGRYKSFPIKLDEYDYDCMLQTYDFGVFYRFSHDIVIEGHIPMGTESRDSAVISYALHKRLGLQPGEFLTINGKISQKSLRVTAIVQDYSTDRGLIAIDYPMYLSLFKDNTVDSFSVYLEDGASLKEVRRNMYKALMPHVPITILTNSEFRFEVLSIMDKFFLILSLIAYTALVIGALSMTSIILSHVIERQRQLSFLRAIGALKRQIAILVLFESIFLGLFGWIFGSFLGLILAKAGVMLIGEGTGFYVKLLLNPRIFVISLVLGIFLAIMASIYPVIKARGLEIVKALQYE